MPSNLFFADSNFPKLTQEQSDSEKIKTIMNYLYQMLEQLRYTLSNLGEGNFNTTELDNIKDPIYAKISDVEGNLTQLRITAEGIQSNVSNLEGEFSIVQQDVNGLSIETAGGTTSITGVTVKSGTIEGSVLKSYDDSSWNSVEIFDGRIYLGRNYVERGRLRYDPVSGNVFLESTEQAGLKLESVQNMSIDANYGDGIYIGSSNDNQTIYLGDSVGETSTVHLFGDIYINGTPIDTYIHDVMGV